MANQSPSPVDPSKPEPPPSELKASDFFPPGVGWNQADDEPGESVERTGNSIDDAGYNRH